MKNRQTKNKQSNDPAIDKTAKCSKDFKAKTANFVVSCLVVSWFGYFYPAFSDKIGLTSDGTATIPGMIINGVIIVVDIILYWVISKNTVPISEKELIKLKKDLQECQNYYDTSRANAEFFSKVILATNKICTEKNKTLDDFIKNIMPKMTTNSRVIISKPENQMHKIIDSLLNCVSAISSIPENNIRVTGCIQEFGIWRWITGLEPDNGDITIEKLMSNPNSTFNATLKSKYIFYNSKIEAEKQNQYVRFSPENLEDGSIIGRRVVFRMPDSEFKISIMYFITTTAGDLLVKEGDEKSIKDVQYMLSQNLFQYIEKRLLIEMKLHSISIYNQPQIAEPAAESNTE